MENNDGIKEGATFKITTLCDGAVNLPIVFQNVNMLRLDSLDAEMVLLTRAMHLLWSFVASACLHLAA